MSNQAKRQKQSGSWDYIIEHWAERGVTNEVERNMENSSMICYQRLFELQTILTIQLLIERLDLINVKLERFIMIAQNLTRLFLLTLDRQMSVQLIRNQCQNQSHQRICGWQCTTYSSGQLTYQGDWEKDHNSAENHSFSVEDPVHKVFGRTGKWTEHLKEILSNQTYREYAVDDISKVEERWIHAWQMPCSRL